MDKDQSIYSINYSFVYIENCSKAKWKIEKVAVDVRMDEDPEEQPPDPSIEPLVDPSLVMIDDGPRDFEEEEDEFLVSDRDGEESPDSAHGDGKVNMFIFKIFRTLLDDEIMKRNFSLFFEKM